MCPVGFAVGSGTRHSKTARPVTKLGQVAFQHGVRTATGISIPLVTAQVDARWAKPFSSLSRSFAAGLPRDHTMYAAPAKVFSAPAQTQMNRRIMVAGAVPYDEYFRWPFLLEGPNHGCATFYLQWNGAPSCRLTSFVSRPSPSTAIPLHRLPRELGHLDILIFNYPLRSVVQGYVLKQALLPTLCFWDYFDDFYYGRKTLPKVVLTSMWEKMCDRVLVLSPTLLPRFHNALHWDNASNLNPGRSFDNSRPVLGTIASLDDRFDRSIYEQLVDACPDCDFHLYGRIHNYRNRNSHGVRRFQTWLDALSSRHNFTYFGPYNTHQLQDIVDSFDIGLIPYVPGPLCEHINPDKYYHYTNAQIPVLSSAIPSLMPRGNILFYSSGEDLIHKVRLVSAGYQLPGRNVRYRWGDRLLELLRATEDQSVD
jgi:hypothetical protein